ncbi:uncharacterized protein LOC104583140 [Brachypodium distachyon]|uniref:Late embryogenesis abundant protein LEA-2 subgroup domain-containing protein n=1 Tax=Brachypodium distachyon TaxID=15368 RepID=A0A0Q3IZ93_BRADI|nr:uncharacterized protein LOC104583140 [Brachypodium distachyon]KQK05708.1 hypothetical protein BRADI_2g22045v3 [Brachypodium distachyon]|eukprot:XP_010233188.1 uncharacterized protein LOC104583140 [Brachypodium distachyon]
MAAPGPRQHRRRRALVRASFAALAVLLLAAAAAILVLTLFRPRPPTTELLSATATGAMPRVTLLPTISIQLNVTFLLVVRVRNPNAASFSFRPGDQPGGSTARLYYRGAPVGEAAVPAGDVPSRGEATLRMDMTVQGEKVAAAAGLGALVGDVLAGEMEFEARTDVKGRVTFLGFVKRSAEARSVCRIVVGVVDVKVRRQECHTDL